MNNKFKEMLNEKLNYTGIKFKDGTHMTWVYGTPLKRPENVNIGDKTKVKVIGKYSDKDIACWVVEWEGKTKQPSGTLLHITTRVDNGAKPIMSGQRATQKGYKKVEPFYIEGVWF